MNILATRTGRVKFFDERGFGFIERSDGGGEVFFHISQVVGDDEPNARDTVSFVITEGRDGKPAAREVRIIP